ncbi:MAG TPA: ABC transporter substrate-binding protein [Acidimicrobiales bacterium]|nr:ABC transporter substrate-binding protein [Acidimicrobiales bacterium]
MALEPGERDTADAGYDRRRFLRDALIGAAGVASIGGVSALLETGAGASTRGLVEGRAATEGALNVIALPPTWANYGNIIKTFQSKYHITVNSANPDGTSAQELAAVTSLKGLSKEPDVVDVSPAIAVQGVKDFQPYKVSTWSTIPANMKDAAGRWYGDYYGVISFGANRSVVKHPPVTWADLKKPEYKGMVSIDGDPRSAGDALAAVWSAALANGGSLDNIMPGLKFFAQLKKLGNWNPVDCYPANISKGTTPIAIVWDYLNLGYIKQFNGHPHYTVSIPTTGRFGNFYCQAISKYAPHPKAAKQWEEFIYSDQGQLLYLAGYAHPARYADLAKRGVIPASLKKLLPPASQYTGVQFPNQAQTAKATKVVLANWQSMVGGA